MFSNDFDALLDQCLARLQGGETLDRILHDHPEQAARLRPLLEVAARMSTLPTPRARPSAFNTGRQRMFDAIDHPVSQTRPGLFNMPLPSLTFLRTLPGMALLALLLIGLTWILSLLDFDINPTGEQTPTLTPTPAASATAPGETPTPTGTASLIPISTQPAFAVLTATITPSPTNTLLPLFTLTPTPTEKARKDDPPPIEPTVPPPYPPPTVKTPPYPPPVSVTPLPTLTPNSTTTLEIGLMTPTPSP